jgi:hypothetical protein
VVFVLFMRGGLISVIRRSVRGWDEPLRVKSEDPTVPSFAGTKAPAPVADR